MWRPSLPSLPSSPRAWIKLIAIVLVLLGLVGGGLWGWMAHKAYKASPEAAVDTLNKAIAAKDFTLFNSVVQTHNVVAQLANATQSNPAPVSLSDDGTTPLYAPPLDANAIQQRNTDFSTVLQELFQATEKPKIPSSFIPVLPENPADVLAQFTTKPFVVRYQDPLVFAETTITLPLSPEPLALRFLLQKIGKVWQVTQFISAPALVTTYNNAVLAELQRRKKAEGLSLEQNRKALARHLPDARCQAGVTRVSGNIPLLVLNLQTGPNPGPESLDGWGLACTITDATGKILLRPRTNSTIKVPQGSPIKQSWSPEISEEQYLMLESAGALTCQAIPEYVILNSGQIFKDPQK